MEPKKADNVDEIVDGTPVTPQISIAHKDVDDSASTNSSLQQVVTPGVTEANFKPTTKLYVAFATLSVITLMVALDGTSLSVALPVRTHSILPLHIFGVTLS